MKVKLLSDFNEESVINTIWSACTTCVSKESPNKIFNSTNPDKKKVISTVMNSAHHSVVEHIYLNWSIEGVSRTLLAQITRHRLTSFSVQSQRACNYEDLEFVVPDSIQQYAYGNYMTALNMIENVYHNMVSMGVPPEDARYILPNAMKTNMMFSLNLRSLMTICQDRLCFKSQREIQELFIEMKEIITEKSPFLSKWLKPKCFWLRRCPEKKTCGYYKGGKS